MASEACLRERLKVIRLPPRSPNLNAFAERFGPFDQGRVRRSDDLLRPLVA
jgi:hypothetical protein